MPVIARESRANGWGGGMTPAVCWEEHPARCGMEDPDRCHRPRGMSLLARKVRAVIGLRIAILIGIMVMTHSGAMAMDPHLQSADGYDPSHDTMMELVCDETEGVSSATRLTLDPLVPSALAVAPGVSVLYTEDTALRGWTAPTIHPDTLRAFLQVFLN